MQIPIQTNSNIDLQTDRCKEDLLYVFNSKMYINEKGYLTKLIDLLYELDYYKNNESLFIRQKG